MCAELLSPVVLENAFVRLEPLCLDHTVALAALTVGAGITRWFPEPLESAAAVERFVADGVAHAAAGSALPFVIIDRTSDQIAGTTRFGAIAAEHERVEIGWTFVGRPWQRTAINTAAKTLLLEHGFERLGCVRVELKTDSRNEASRTAILRIGALEEGTLRRHMTCSDGHQRDTIYFSLLANEWPAVKERLLTRLNRDRIHG